MENTNNSGFRKDGTLLGNHVEVEGYIDTVPQIHHRTHDEDIYSFILRVPRRNAEVSDFIPIEISERVTEISSISVGKVVRIDGQFRSFNRLNRETGKAKLNLSVFVRDISFMDIDLENPPEFSNNIHLTGFICKKPVFRTTPTGREICDMILAVNRVYGRSDYIPCISWSRNARFASNLEVGTKVNVDGRIQSRTYYKRVEGKEEAESHVVYEVSVFSIIEAAQEQTSSDNSETVSEESKENSES